MSSLIISGLSLSAKTRRRLVLPLRGPELFSLIVTVLVSGGLLLLSMLIQPGISAAATPGDAVHAFDNIYISGLYSISVDEMLYLLDISKGKELTPVRIRSGIKRAFLKEIFDDILFERKPENRIDIIVKEKKIVHSVEVEGQEILSGRTIRKQMGILPGERIFAPKIEKKLLALEENIAYRGFPHAAVDYRIVPLEGNRAVLHVTVKEGPPDIVKEIAFTNAEAELPISLPLSVGDIIDRTELDAFRVRLMAKMKKNNRIKGRFTYSFSDGRLTVSYDRGREVIVEFAGNSALSAGKLMREITFYEIDDISDELIEETMSRVISRYHKEGYAFVRIVPSISESDEAMTVSFFIHEGEKCVVESVGFSGASLNTQRLSEVLLLRKGNPFNPDEAGSDRDSLIDLYQSLGFVSVNVERPKIHFDGPRVSIHYEINEGKQVRIDTVSVKNNLALPAEELLAGLKVKAGNPYNAIDLLDSRRIVRERYQQKGYLNAIVAASTQIDDVRAHVTFDITEGSKTFFGKKIVVGNQRTKEGVISREFIHKDGDPFNFAVVYDERVRLYKTGLFDDIEIAAVDIDDPRKDVVYRLSESPSGEFEFGFGYSNFEKFRGFVNARYNNLWGLNKRISIRTELSELNNRFLVSYDEPWFVSREIPLKILLLAENKKELNYNTQAVLYKLDRFLASVGTEAQLSARVKAELYYSGSITKTYDVQPDVILSKEDVGTLFISSIRSGLIYDSRNNTFTPSQGILAGVSLEVASAFLLSQTDYAKLSMNLNLYRGITEWLVGALSLRGGIAAGYRDTDELPIVKRYFLGGRTTVRGYKEDTLGPKGSDGNPTGGNAFLMGNFEFRSDIWKGLGAVAFVDMGNVWQKISDIDIAQIRFTTGLGLRYNTPVGPLSIDYGMKLSRLEGESKGVLYFTIGNAF